VSIENVVLFIKDANKKPELNGRLAQNPTIDEWVKIAKEAGFDFTPVEFTSAVEETIKKKVTPENAVQELLTAQQAVGSGELSKRALDAVVGGVTVRYIKMEPLFIQVAKPPTRLE
jgi:predicted ribosomally synthesized peptide with nif11-like leader